MGDNNIEIEVEIDQPTGTKDHNKLINTDLPDQHPISAITNLQTTLDSKVDEEEGKSLINDDLITKLEGIETGAEVNTVTSVAGKTGAVTLNKNDVGLNNVDNTSDLNKPISTATQTALNGKQPVIQDLADIRTGAGKGATAAQPADIKDATLTIQKNGTNVGTFSANASQDKTINLNIPVNAGDVNALPTSTKYAANISVSINTTTFVITFQLKDQNGDNLGTAQSIDLPLESVVVNGSYNSNTKKVILTLQNGSEIEFSVADLISGLQSEINANNKLSADFVDDNSTTHKFVSALEKATWNAKQNAISGAATTITNDNLSAEKVVTSNASGKIEASSIKKSELEKLSGISSNIQAQLDLKQDKDDIVYDIVINDVNDSNPTSCVSYAGINTTYTPAGMNYTSGQFDYGSWANAFFLSLFKPCMLKSDGTVDYYLNPDDYEYRDDKITPSDVSNANYDGNAMVEIGQIWISEKVVDDKKYIRIANRKITDDFECITHRKKDGTYTDKIYRALFDGSLIDGKIRSIKGQTVCKNQTGQNQITYAKANGTGWNIDEYAVRRLINYLLILMGKSLNTQAVFGQGVTSGAEAGQVVTGTLSNKGMFFGANNTTTAVKVFHIENWWGNTWKLTNGLVAKNGRLYYKMCEGTYDGSTAEEYSEQATGYIDSGITLSGTSGSFIKTSTLIRGLGLVPNNISGSDSTYYCDGCWFNLSASPLFARFGGHSLNGSKCGAFSCLVLDYLSYSYWGFGVSLSYKKAS